MLVISATVYEIILRQSRAEAPLEACGMLSGNGNKILTAYPMTNADASAEHFTLLPEEQFAVTKLSRAAGEKILAVYHSHPATPARPSAEDIRLAAPGIIHLILSLAGDSPCLRGFSIEEGRVTPVRVEIERGTVKIYGKYEQGERSQYGFNQ